MLALGLPTNVEANSFSECLLRCKKWLGLSMETTLSRSVAHVDQYLAAVIRVRKPELAENGQKSDSPAATTIRPLLRPRWPRHRLLHCGRPVRCRTVGHTRWVELGAAPDGASSPSGESSVPVASA